MDYVFAFDVSQEAVRSGFLKIACAVLLAALFGDGESIPSCFPQESRIAILAFDRTLQFYNLSVRLLPQLHALIPLYNMLFIVRNRWSTADVSRTRRRRRLPAVARWSVREGSRFKVSPRVMRDGVHVSNFRSGTPS